jgi:polysaccharide export outer membrane protein
MQHIGKKSRWPVASGCNPLWQRATRALSVALLLLATACAAGPQGPELSSPASPQSYRLGHGDRVAVTVFGEKDMSGEYDIDDTGNLPLPLAGAIKVENMTPRQAEQAVTQRLTRGGLMRDPQVTVSVVRYRPVYILGEVQRPGAYPYQSGMSILNAVALAGGYTYRAQTKRISVVRPTEGDKQAQVAAETSYIAPGDIIIIPERWF